MWRATDWVPHPSWIPSPLNSLGTEENFEPFEPEKSLASKQCIFTTSILWWSEQPWWGWGACRQESLLSAVSHGSKFLRKTCALKPSSHRDSAVCA